MKRLRYILACMLSFLIIHVGAGAAIMHYCCNQCEIGTTCCDSICDHCDKPDCHEEEKDEHASSSCADDGCSVSIYKVDLAAHFSEKIQGAVALSVFYLDSSILLPFLPHVAEVTPAYPDSSPPKGARHALALYCTFLI